MVPALNIKPMFCIMIQIWTPLLVCLSWLLQKRKELAAAAAAKREKELLLQKRRQEAARKAVQKRMIEARRQRELRMQVACSSMFGWIGGVTVLLSLLCNGNLSVSTTTSFALGGGRATP